MTASDVTQGEPGSATEQFDIENYLEQREKMDSLFAEKFTRTLTVMFTDLKGSTAIAEAEGDLIARQLIKNQSDIVHAGIAEHHGVFVKGIGDGTLSYFEHAQDALRAAVRIQRAMDELNLSKKYKTPVLMRIGMHTGRCVVEKSDIYGDVVNTASRFESAAHAGEIYLSEETYNALADKSEIYCRFVEQVMLKGKKDPFNAYKAFWNPTEVEIDKKVVTGHASDAAAKLRSRLLRIGAAVLVIGLFIALGPRFFGSGQKEEEKRTITHSVADTPPSPASR